MTPSASFCTQCGTAIAPGSPFCSACGAVQRPAASAETVRQAKKGMPTVAKVSVAIMGSFLLLVAVAVLMIPNILRHGDSARLVKVHADIQNFMTGLEAYKLDTGEFPTADQGLRALRAKPAGVIAWAGPYIQAEMPKDPWGRDYVYKYPGDHGAEPDIISLGADGQPGGDGMNADIVSWNKD